MKIEKLRRIRLLIAAASIIVLCSACHTSFAQFTLTGQSGALLVPEARVIGDKKIAIGSGFHPQQEAFILYPSRRGTHEIYNFVTIGFLPFMEMTFNLTQIVDGGPHYGIGDRSGAMRFLLLKEGDRRPGVQLGTYIPFGTSNYLSSNFLTVSKNLRIWHNTLILTGGYGVPYVLRGSLFHALRDVTFSKKENDYQEGFFASSRFEVLKIADVCLEYDSNNFNTGIIMRLAADRLFIKVYTLNFQTVGGSLSYQGDIR